jgi:hypothetical protein
MVMTPCFGGLVTSVYATSIAKLTVACQNQDMILELKMHGGDALITRARAEMVATFMENAAATHLLFIDADIGFEPEQAFRLISLGVDVAAAVYPMKRFDWPKIAAMAAQKKPRLESSALTYVVGWSDRQGVRVHKGFARVKFAGMGFMIVTRAAITKLYAAHPELKYQHAHVVGGPSPTEQHRFALFDPIIDRVTGEYLSEDLAFCRRWTDLGGEIWMDMQSRLDHVGSITFKGDLVTQFVIRGSSGRQ